MTAQLTLDEFFKDFEDSRRIFDRLLTMIEESSLVEMRITRSQIALVDKKPFAWAWIPTRYLKGKSAPLVLSVSFPEKDLSPRWKQIVEPAKGRFMHHLELFLPADIDDEVRGWLARAQR